MEKTVNVTYSFEGIGIGLCKLHQVLVDFVVILMTVLAAVFSEGIVNVSFNGLLF